MLIEDSNHSQLYKEHGDGYQVIMVMGSTFGPSRNPKPPHCHAFGMQKEGEVPGTYLSIHGNDINNLGRKTGEGPQECILHLYFLSWTICRYYTFC